ncbi:MAG: hypothetical protein JF617_00105 [Burkholderiales bacterium]|nr:hypothetical protein [Burkholderiales bacterium]
MSQGGGHDPQQGGLGVVIQVAPPGDGVERRGLRQHDVGGRGRQHLGRQGRAAARHVEDQAGRLLGGQDGGPGLQVAENGADAEQPAERQEAPADQGVVVERLVQPPPAEAHPGDRGATVHLRHLGRQPAGPGREPVDQGRLEGHVEQVPHRLDVEGKAPRPRRLGRALGEDREVLDIAQRVLQGDVGQDQGPQRR